MLGLFRRWKKKAPEETQPEKEGPVEPQVMSEPAVPAGRAAAPEVEPPAVAPKAAPAPRAPHHRAESAPRPPQHRHESTPHGRGGHRHGPPPPAPRSPRADAVPIAEDGSGPLVIPRAEHNLSRRKISPNALKVMRRLIGNGYRAYLVGGCVRDILIDRTPKDFDVVTDAHPEQVRALFRNCRLIGRRFRLAHVFFQGNDIIEVSTFRQGVTFDTESDEPIRDENSYGTPATDAQRRDLTINGLFYDLETFNIYDFVGGMQDLRERTIRIIGDPGLRIREDPARMIRAIRHAARTGFTIEPATLAAIREYAGEITKVNPSRLRDEFLRELKDGQSAKSIALMLETGLLPHIVPSACAALTSDGADAVRARLLAMLGALDEALAKREIPLPVVLAVFVSPLLPELQAPPAEGEPRRTLQQTMRDCVKPMLREIGIGRGDSEATVSLLVGKFAIARAMAKGGQIPGNVMRKSYFEHALALCQIEAQARGETLPKPIARAARARGRLLFVAPGDVPMPRRRRRGGRRRRSGEAAGGNGGNGHGHGQAHHGDGRLAAASTPIVPAVDPSLVFSAESRERIKTGDNQ